MPIVALPIANIVLSWRRASVDLDDNDDKPQNHIASRLLLN